MHLRSICDGIATLWGGACEAVLHDFGDIDHSVVYIAGNVTGREIGAPLTGFGLQVLMGNHSDQDVLAYYSKAPDGTLMKSVSILLRNEQRDRIIGALCINMAIEPLQRTREILTDLVSLPTGELLEEHFAGHPQGLIQSLTKEFVDQRGWILADCSREQRLEIVRWLDHHGAFALRSAPKIVAELLGVSRFTVYNYLKQLRSGAREAE